MADHRFFPRLYDTPPAAGRGPFLLARSCVAPDEAFPSMAALCQRLIELAAGRPTRFRPAAVARGPGRAAGACVAVAVDRRGPFEHAAYVFLPGTLAGDDAALRRAFAQARDAGPAAFRAVALGAGVALDFAA